MSGAGASHAEWCPDWYTIFEAAQVLGVPPWELAGFEYVNASEAPICWRYWAIDFYSAKSAAAAKQQAAMLGSLGMGR